MHPNRPSCLRALAALIVLLTAAILTPACSKNQGADALATADAGAGDYAHFVATDDGRVIVANANRQLKRAAWYTLVPHRWPSDEPRPILGTGRLVRQGGDLLAVQLVNVQVEDLGALELIPADGPAVPEKSKSIGVVTAVDGDTITVPIPSEAYVTIGDLYFILTRETLSREARMGDMLGAIARVDAVRDDSITLHVIHAQDAIEPGDLAVFAQPAGSDERQEFQIYVAPMAQNAPAIAPGELPPLMQAMPAFLARYGLGAVGVESLDTWIDPRPWDAAIDASDQMPDHEWGVVVFGDTEPGRFIYNATGFGAAPEPDSSVGILAGGLPVRFEHDLGELSPQLVPSFVANGLGMRGEHALAVYILENELRNTDLDPLVRYHLREHLALRYNSLNAAAEALRIMNHDIAQATERGETYPLLNALSIRAHLSSQSGLAHQWLEDHLRFIEVGEPILPADSLDAERTELAVALVVNGEIDRAEAMTTEVISRAEASGDQRMLFSALFAMARIQLARENPAAALLVLDDLAQASEAYPIEQRVGLQMVLAELYSGLEIHEEAFDALVRAFEGFRDVSDYSRATMLRRSAAIFDKIDRKVEAARSIQDAAELFVDLHILQDAAFLFADLAHRKLTLAFESEPALALQFVLEAKHASVLSSHIFLMLGQTLHAASQLSTVAWIDAQLRRADESDERFRQAWELARASAAIEPMVNIADAHAQMAHVRGDEEQATTLRDTAMRWAEFGDVDYDFEEFDAQASE